MKPARVLGAVWGGIKALVGRLPGRARALWYAPFFIGSAGQVFNVWAQLAGDEPPDYGHALTAAILAVMLALWPIRARQEFRQAWRTGFLEGIHVPAELGRGRVPDVMTRQTVTGTATPEPWEASASWDLTVMTVRGKRETEGE